MEEEYAFSATSGFLNLAPPIIIKNLIFGTLVRATPWKTNTIAHKKSSNIIILSCQKRGQLLLFSQVCRYVPWLGALEVPQIILHPVSNINIVFFVNLCFLEIKQEYY